MAGADRRYPGSWDRRRIRPGGRVARSAQPTLPDPDRGSEVDQVGRSLRRRSVGARRRERWYHEGASAQSIRILEEVDIVLVRCLKRTKSITTSLDYPI